MLSLKTFAIILLSGLTACNATDSVHHYESKDTLSGPRIDNEHLMAPPDTPRPEPDRKRRDSASLTVPPPGETDTAKLNIQQVSTRNQAN